MIKHKGKTYVILEFPDEADAAFFETAFFDRHRGDLYEAAMQAKIQDDAFAGLDDVNVVNNNASGTIHGVVNQIGVVGNRVQ